ncbi:hypothetical protein H6798_01215 [Candidatus Nomurabacteria bacterium]|nr:hypothetical protein [Candidatus Nomurabacteria bacterium]
MPVCLTISYERWAIGNVAGLANNLFDRGAALVADATAGIEGIPALRQYEVGVVMAEVVRASGMPDVWVVLELGHDIYANYADQIARKLEALARIMNKVEPPSKPLRISVEVRLVNWRGSEIDPLGKVTRWGIREVSRTEIAIGGYALSRAFTPPKSD